MSETLSATKSTQSGWIVEKKQPVRNQKGMAHVIALKGINKAKLVVHPSIDDVDLKQQLNDLQNNNNRVGEIASNLLKDTIELEEENRLLKEKDKKFEEEQLARHLEHNKIMKKEYDEWLNKKRKWDATRQSFLTANKKNKRLRTNVVVLTGDDQILTLQR